MSKDITLGFDEKRVPVMRNHKGKPSAKPAPSAPKGTMGEDSMKSTHDLLDDVIKGGMKRHLEEQGHFEEHAPPKPAMKVHQGGGQPSKGGEGARGGKIIGHTSTGHPIYAKGQHQKAYGPKEHHEAYVAHGHLASQHSHEAYHNNNEFGDKDRAKHRAAAEHHSKMAQGHKAKWEAHETLGAKIPSYEQSFGHVVSNAVHPMLKPKESAKPKLKVAKSGEDMKKDLFKSLGFTVGQPSLIEEVKDSVGEQIEKGFWTGQLNRVGAPGNAHDRLMSTLGNNDEVTKSLSSLTKGYGSENLKDTHGEEFHSDAKLPKESLEVHEVDSVHDIDEEENPKVREGKKKGDHQYTNQTKNRDDKDNSRAPIKRSMSQEELFLKALDGIGKSSKEEACMPAPTFKKKMKKGPIVEWAKEEEKEHEHAKKSLFPKKN